MTKFEIRSALIGLAVMPDSIRHPGINVRPISSIPARGPEGHRNQDPEVPWQQLLFTGMAFTITERSFGQVKIRIVVPDFDIGYSDSKRPSFTPVEPSDSSTGKGGFSYD